LDIKLFNCEILSNNITRHELINPELPTDTYYIEYDTEDGIVIDLCRSSKMANVFDLYYDKVKNNIRKIDFAYGKKNPKLWGYNSPTDKKRRAR
jgi:hypothetical protein